MSGIYQIAHSSGKAYIGSSVNFDGRWKLHRKRLRKGTHHSTYLQRSWNRYGESEFKFQPIIICAGKDLLMYEQRFLDALAPVYNVCKVAGNSLGVKRSAETRAKNAARARGNTNFRGRKHTPEALAKLSAASLGNQYLLGYKHSEESRAKMRASSAGGWAKRRAAKACQTT
jgi:group I intron endonuclease